MYYYISNRLHWHGKWLRNARMLTLENVMAQHPLIFHKRNES